MGVLWLLIVTTVFLALQAFRCKQHTEPYDDVNIRLVTCELNRDATQALHRASRRLWMGHGPENSAAGTVFGIKIVIEFLCRLICTK